MKKYKMQLLINQQMTISYWEGIESDKAPVKINDGVVQIEDVYYNAINIEEMIITENHPTRLMEGGLLFLIEET